MNYPMISAFHKLYKYPDKDLGSYSALRSRYPKSQGYFQNYFGMSSTQVGLREYEVSESRFSFFTKLVFVLLLALGLLAKAQLVPEKPAVLYPVYDKAGLLSESEEDALNQKLIKFADFKLVKGGFLFFELHELYGEEVKQYLQIFEFEKIEIRKDLQGKSRMLKAQKV